MQLCEQSSRIFLRTPTTIQKAREKILQQIDKSATLKNLENQVPCHQCLLYSSHKTHRS